MDEKKNPTEILVDKVFGFVKEISGVDATIKVEIASGLTERVSVTISPYGKEVKVGGGKKSGV